MPFPATVGVTLLGIPWNLGGDGIVVGAFSLLAQAQLGVWMRLLDEAGLPISVLLVAEELTDSLARDAELTFPPSQRSRVVLVKDTGRRWSQTVDVPSLDLAFAAVIVKGVAQPLMIGSPTEEAWDRFMAAARSLVSTTA